MSDQSRRVLITGVSRLWGAMLAERLEADPAVEEIIAIDRHRPARPLARTEFIQADVRHRLVVKLIRALGIDTVVHAGTILDTRHASRRMVHETNVIGTMNLLAACGGANSPVRTVVVKSGTAIYGSSAAGPSVLSETSPRRSDSGAARDLLEMEDYVADFAMRRPEVRVTTLRVADVLGASGETPFAAYLGQPVVPTVFGFDPRLQFVHEEDVVGALLQAIAHPVAGTFNVAGHGIVVLSQAIRMVGRINLPLLPFAGTAMAVSLLRSARLLELSDHMPELLLHGRVVDTSALETTFGYMPRHRTLDCVTEFSRWRRERGLVEERYHTEEQIDTVLRARAAASTGR